MKQLKTYNLFLDDLRVPTDCGLYIDEKRYIEFDWLVVKSYSEFKSVIEEKWQNGAFPSIVSFDHDLDHEHYDPSMFVSSEAYENAYKGFTIPTGRKAAEYLVHFCREKQIALPECLIHTMNPAGEIRILDTLNRIYD